jgi:hypothetical protein
MCQETRSLCACLQDFRRAATRDGLSRSEIARELLELRERGRDFAKQELLNHRRESLRLAQSL